MADILIFEAIPLFAIWCCRVCVWRLSSDEDELDAPGWNWVSVAREFGTSPEDDVG